MKFIKKLIKILVLLLILLIVGVFVYSKINKPTYSGELEINNLSDEVVVYFDEVGVPHINAQNQKDAFIKDTEKLKGISAVKGLFYGAPAATDRAVVEKSYHFAVIVHFDNLEGHDSYQKDQIHLDLLTNHGSIWERVMVTDVNPH